MDKVQINFYGILSEQYSNILVRLLAKAMETEQYSLVVGNSKEDITLIDDSLWRSAIFWLPHCYIGNSLQEHNPIVLTTMADYLSGKYGISNKIEYLFLINPEDLKIANYFSKFKKVFILFLSQDDKIILNIRTLWKELLQNNHYHLQFYQQNPSGKFVLKTDKSHI